MKYLSKNRMKIYTPAQSLDCLAFGEKPCDGGAYERPRNSSTLDQALTNALIQKEFQ